MTTLPHESRGFALFAEVLRTGLLVTLCGAAVVTAVPAVAAGTSHLRRFVRGETDSMRAYLIDFAAAVRDLWLLGAGTVLVGLLLALNAVVVSSGGVPGAAAVGPVIALAGLAGAVVCLRAVSLWRPADRRARHDGRGSVPDGFGTRPEPRGVPTEVANLLRNAARLAYRDAAGSVWIVAAVGACVVLVWMLTPLVVVVPGLLAFALVARE